MAKRSEDRFSNLASAAVTEAVAATMAYTEVQTGVSLGQGVGILIDQISYIFDTSTLALIIANSDYLQSGWYTSNNNTVFALDQNQQIDMIQLTASVAGVATSMQIVESPMVHQFFPPLIVAAPRIYLAIRGVSLASVATVRSRMYFRYIDLTSQEYLELAETFILVG